MDCSPPGSSIRGIFQARVLEWIAISFSRVSSWPRDGMRVSRIAGRRFTVWATRQAQRLKEMSFSVMLDSLWPRVLYSPGALQAWILEWGASPFSRGSSQPRDRTQVSCNEGRFFSSWATREALEIVNLNGMQVHAQLRHSVCGDGVAMTGCSWAVCPCAEDTAQNSAPFLL